MTLLDLCKILKRNWLFIAIISVICAVVCGGVIMMMPKTYQTSAIITASAEVNTVGGIGQSVAAENSSNQGQLSASTDANAKKVTITAKGSNPTQLMTLANITAYQVVQKAEELFPDTEEVNYSFMVTRASTASDVSPSVTRYALVAFLAGLFVSICIVIIVDLVRRPIKSSAEVEELLSAPVLGTFDSDPLSTKRLLANIRFAVEDADKVAIIAISDFDSADQICQALSKEASADGRPVPEFVACQPFTQNIDSSYVAHEAGHSVFVARQWVDSLNQLEAEARESLLADAKIDGVALLPEGDAANAHKGLGRIIR